MLNIPPHLEACRPRGLFSIFHGTSSPVARRCPRASDLVLSAEHAFLLYERPGLHLQSGASAVGGVLRGARRFGKRSPARCSNFNPRTRWGRDAATLTSLRIHVPFQSTPPVRGATTGARKAGKARPVSIHAPRAGCDGSAGRPSIAAGWYFNPRTPCGVRLVKDALDEYEDEISIHAPRAGCDPFQPVDYLIFDLFQSTHPVRGATLYGRNIFADTARFQSTHPVRGATVKQLSVDTTLAISIHAPRAGCDHVHFVPVVK